MLLLFNRRKKMGYWQTRGLRGSDFEDLINRTNRIYMDDDLAVIQKIPTSIKPVRLDKEKGVITLAYFDEKSTVDYVGNVQGIPVCFDAKQTNKKSLPIANIHEHQVRFMDKFDMQGGLAFILVHFSLLDEYYILGIERLIEFYNSAMNGGRKSIPYDEIKKGIRVYETVEYPLHYLEGIEKYLTIKEGKDAAGE